MGVKVYTTPTCPYCIMAKRFLKENNVKFEELDVSSNERALAEMLEKTGQQGVPVIDVDGQLIVGFDKDELKAALEKTSSKKKK